MPLHYHREGRATATQTAWMLHGILGSGQNLRSVARRLAADLPGWSFVLPDLRNHGESHGLPGPDTVASCVEDLYALGTQLGVAPEIAIGHSFGGKVALMWGAEAQARGLGVRQVWALDVPPGPPDLSVALRSEVVRVVRALREIPVPIDRRDQIVELLVERGFSAAMGQWMTTNLRNDGNGYRWRFNLDGVEAMLHDYATVDAWPWLESVARGPRVDVVRAGRSDRWSAAEQARFPLPNLHLHTLHDAGHWLHVDDPDGLHALLVREGSFW